MKWEDCCDINLHFKKMYIDKLKKKNEDEKNKMIESIVLGQGITMLDEILSGVSRSVVLCLFRPLLTFWSYSF